MALKDCLWNNPAALREQSKALKLQGFADAAQGCLDRAVKVERLFARHGANPKNTRPFEEPVDF
jgi:hypothetical protein